MNAPIFVLIELALAGLLSASVTRFNLQLVGANLPIKDETELEIAVRQTTGFALIAGALSVQAGDNLFFCGFHSLQTALLVSGIMAVVLFWKSVPTVCAKACSVIDEGAEAFVGKVEKKVAKLSAAVVEKFATEAPETSTASQSERQVAAFNVRFASVKEFAISSFRKLAALPAALAGLLGYARKSTNQEEFDVVVEELVEIPADVASSLSTQVADSPDQALSEAGDSTAAQFPEDLDSSNPGSSHAGAAVPTSARLAAGALPSRAPQ